jgi:hypothetical protein
MMTGRGVVERGEEETLRFRVRVQSGLSVWGAEDLPATNLGLGFAGRGSLEEGPVWGRRWRIEEGVVARKRSFCQPRVAGARLGRRQRWRRGHQRGRRRRPVVGRGPKEEEGRR